MAQFKFPVLPFCVLIALLGGCVSSDRPSATPAEPVAIGLPRDRMGCLPFPGMFTLYALADPDRLGDHHYGRSRDPDASAETERGIVYTTRAGFLDVAHLRNTIDWTRYCVDRLASAIERGDTSVAFNGTNGSLVHVSLNYPDDWSNQPSETQRKLTAELALRGGERLAYALLTYHETATWYGDHTFLFDESASAFTWDDVMSHVIGVRIADLALRSGDWPFDKAVTFFLADQLRRLGVVEERTTQAAVNAVENVWWARGQPLKRQLDLGLDGRPVTPWLVPGMAFVDRPPESFDVPNLRNVAGRDYTSFYGVRIEPRSAAGDRMREGLADRQTSFDTDHNLPTLLAEVRAKMVAQYGQSFGTPWPVVTVPISPSATPTHAILPGRPDVR